MNLPFIENTTQRNIGIIYFHHIKNVLAIEVEYPELNVDTLILSKPDVTDFKQIIKEFLEHNNLTNSRKIEFFKEEFEILSNKDIRNYHFKLTNIGELYPKEVFSNFPKNVLEYLITLNFNFNYSFEVDYLKHSVSVYGGVYEKNDDVQTKKHFFILDFCECDILLPEDLEKETVKMLTIWSKKLKKDFDFLNKRRTYLIFEKDLNRQEIIEKFSKLFNSLSELKNKIRIFTK
ncbi:MAG: hypothetical protein PWR32_38 [Candidatus Woesearchaeota archaeon]|nr:hypothetical protein [Candidatus Woesearchaeota archaeon]